MELMNRSFDQLQADVNTLKEQMESTQQGLIKVTRNLTTQGNILTTNLEALRNRVKCVESIPALKEWNALRGEVDKLRSEVDKMRSSTPRIPMPGAASSISPSQLQELKTAVIQELKLPGLGLQSNDDLRWDLSGIKQEVDENAFKSESLLYATRKLYDKVKELETSSSSAAERAGGSDQRPYTPSPNVTEEMLDLTISQVNNSQVLLQKVGHRRQQVKTEIAKQAIWRG